MNRQFAHLCLTALMVLPLAGMISQSPPLTEVAHAANQVKLTINPNQSRYPRGEQLRITAQVFGNGRKLVQGTPILVQEIYFDSGRRRTVERKLASAVTDANGMFTLNYQVPTDPNKDKVTLVFVNPVSDGDSTSFVIPIGK